MTLNSSNTLGSALRGEYKAIWRNDYKHSTNTVTLHNSKPTLIDNDIPLTKLRFFLCHCCCFFFFVYLKCKKSYRDCLYTRSTKKNWLRLMMSECGWKRKYTWCKTVSIVWIVIFAHSGFFLCYLRIFICFSRDGELPTD